MPRVRIAANEVQLDAVAWQSLRKHTQGILGEFRPLGAKQVNLRLNESEKESKLPVFIDWIALPSVSAKIANRSAEADIGKYRLGETTPSIVYNEGVAQAGKKIIERDWTCKQLLKEKRVESKLAVQKAGLMYQKFIGIIAGEKPSWRCVGLLTVSFEKKPKKVDLNEVENKMKKLASWPESPKSDPVKSEFVNYLEEVFILGGPFVKRAMNDTRKRS
jgi:hypothetical protein